MRVILLEAEIGCLLALGLATFVPSPFDPPLFVDITASSGVSFQHISGNIDDKHYIPETKGGGTGLFDYDNDGFMDLYMVQGSTVERYRRADNPHSELFRNRGDGTFEKVTLQARITTPGWGMGVTFGDFDNDGFADIYQTNLGPNVLYRNNGNGTFSDVTAAAGVGDSRWSTSAAFADYDNDGDLDLYVANYVFLDFDHLPAKACRHRDAIVLCGPMGLPGEADVLYRNNGDGTFTDVSVSSGASDSQRYYGLGVVWSDLDNDGDLDIVVANDATPNLFFVNEGNGTFEEMGLLSGLAVNAEGREQASMGADAADFDNDGLLDVYMTHFSDDYSTLYRNEGKRSFRDITSQAQIVQAEMPLVSWGTRFADFNLDGWKDIFHANGHVYPYLKRAGLNEKFEQPCTLYINSGKGTFSDASRSAGPDLQVGRVSRGAAFGDIDNDGDLDVVLANMNGSPTLLRNDRRDRNHWVMFRTVGKTTNRDGIGTRIIVGSGGLNQHWEVKRALAIYSASDPRAHFGLGSNDRIETVRVQWPSGKIQEFTDLPADKHYLLHEEEGLRLDQIAPGDK